MLSPIIQLNHHYSTNSFLSKETIQNQNVYENISKLETILYVCKTI